MKCPPQWVKALFAMAVSWSCVPAQYVPFYPIEVYYGFVGSTNSVPGCDPKLHATFSAVKVDMVKDLPSTKHLTNTFVFTGSIEHYHSHTGARTYFPFMVSPLLRSHFFATDIFTLGTEINGTLEFFPHIESTGNARRYNNYKARVRPFWYLIATPNAIVKMMATLGACRNSDKVGKDYDIFKYELRTIFLMKHNTRLFAVPYLFNDAYHNLPARSGDGALNPGNPNLKEQGYGLTLGARHGSFRFGYSEAAFEYEKNVDMIYGANSYHKVKFISRWENHYFTERFGFLLMGDAARYISKEAVYGFPDPSRPAERLGQVEIMADIMLIFNINRNVSLRPEYTKIYKHITGGNEYDKDRYALNVHVFL
ncbi:MAG: hypothetical protein JW768_15440 [Chitinispirillaceae bacterium]|nr:hypothetical protein [Chitinispirillaceae bacterium]